MFTYSCASLAMTNGDKKRVDAFQSNWCYRRLPSAQGVKGGEENEQMGDGQDCIIFMLKKSMAERKMRFFGSIAGKKALKNN